MSDDKRDEADELPDEEPEVMHFKVPKKGPRPWDFDLDNLPDEFTIEIVRRLRMSELRALENADLSERQRESLNAAQAELFAPMKDAFSNIIKDLRINEQLAETLAPLNESLKATFAKMAPKVDYSHLFPKQDLSHLFPKIDPDKLAGIARPGRFSSLEDMGILLDKIEIGPSPETKLLGEIVDHQAEELAERREQVERERQMLQLFAQSAATQQQIAETQAELLAEQQRQGEEAKVTRRIDKWVLRVAAGTGLVAALTLVVTFTALQKM